MIRHVLAPRAIPACSLGMPQPPAQAALMAAISLALRPASSGSRTSACAIAMTAIAMSADVDFHAATGAEKAADRLLHRRSMRNRRASTNEGEACYAIACDRARYGGGDDIRGKLARFGRMSSPVSPVVYSYRFSDADISYPGLACLPNQQFKI
jgi:hypothetical protein